jgi:hypothetical protein
MSVKLSVTGFSGDSIAFTQTADVTCRVGFITQLQV